jgi:Xaa-Pro aminopeptidase
MTRADRLAARLAEQELDVLLVTENVNVRYLTGYTGSNGLALVGADGRAFVTDFRYVTQARDEVEGFERRRGSRDLLDAIEPALPPGPLRLGFEDLHLPVRRHRELRELLPARIELVPAGGLVEELRLVKDAGEVQRLRAGAELADAAFEHVVGEGLVGRSERDVALALEVAMRRAGAEAPSFEPIVAAGAHGALPHARPRDVAIPPDALVVLDWGARVDGYCSDCTRTLATGEAISEEAREVYALVQRAQAAALDAVRAGAEARALDGVAREMIAEAGHGAEFGHPLGHGVGLEVHEAPRLGAQNPEPVADGTVVTIEPGVYVPDRFGVRIEDLVVVADGGRDVLSTLPKGLRVVA